jgi:hypothetical protein
MLIDDSTSYLDKTLPAVHVAAREFHLAVREWIASARAPASAMGVLAVATRRARVALEVAAHSQAYRRQLQRARENMLTCLAEFPTLTDEGYFCDELCLEARRRIDQILRGIDQLLTTPVEEWLKVELPPIERTEPLDNSSVAATRQALKHRIAAIANVSRYFPTSRGSTKPRNRRRANAPAPENEAEQRLNSGIV